MRADRQTTRKWSVAGSRWTFCSHKIQIRFERGKSGFK